jgi:NADPH-dependent ferric siderophore reductase
MDVAAGAGAGDAGRPGPPSLGTSALLRRLGDASRWELEVTGNLSITPSMRRIRCTAPGLADLAYLPGQDLMFAVPAADGTSFRRRYTIRSIDRPTSSIDVDIVLHGDGPGSAWAASARPGARIEAIGPRGKVTVDQAADWHLFAGDDSALPASLAMAESLPSADAAVVVLEVDGPADQQLASTADGRAIPVHWVHRAGADPDSSTNLVAALRGLAIPPGPGHAYLAGELGMVADMRATLLERGLAPEQISAKPYWRAGVANAAHGEPERPAADG